MTFIGTNLDFKVTVYSTSSNANTVQDRAIVTS